MNKRAFFVLASAALISLVMVRAIPSFSYVVDVVKNPNNGALSREHWPNGTATWRINPSHGGNLTGSRTVQDVIQASFNTWAGGPNIALTPTRGADSSLTAPNSNDGVNLVCFVCTGDFSKEAQTLAVTMVSVDEATGNIVDADILFSPNVTYSTDGPNGDSVHDLQTVATHEIGHFFGLGHSAVVRAVMFPFAPDSERILSYDDVAAMSSNYPKAGVPTGSIAGTVKLNGSAVFGAHVFADSVTANQAFGSAARKTPIGALTLTDGTYRIDGVPADSYTVGAEPLDLPVTNADVQSGFSDAFGRSVQTNFTTRWH